MNIIIGADLVPTKSNQDLFMAGDAETLIGGELKKILDNSDYRIFNLEVPLTDIEDPIQKWGPNLIAPTKTVNGYKAIGADALTLANNHILDQGDEGLRSTIDVLKNNNISCFGSGNNLNEACEPHIFVCDGKKIGVYACAEHEFSIASLNSPGANPFDPLESLDHVTALKEKCDFVIVLYHGGKEHYRYPSPNLQKVCRKLIEKGADLVICQHTHCIGCEEKYKSGTIVYGQGNFLFDGNGNEYWETSLLVSIQNNFDITYIPLVKVKNTVRAADLSRASQILEQFEKRSEEIKQNEFIERKYAEFAQSMLNHYLVVLNGKKSPFFKVVRRLLNIVTKRKFGAWYLKRVFNKRYKLAVNNYIECEAHRELLLNGLKGKI